MIDYKTADPKAAHGDAVILAFEWRSLGRPSTSVGLQYGVVLIRRSGDGKWRAFRGAVTPTVEVLDAVRIANEGGAIPPIEARAYFPEWSLPDEDWAR